MGARRFVAGNTVNPTLVGDDKQAMAVELTTNLPGLVLRELELADAQPYYELIDRNRGHLTQNGNYEKEGRATLASVQHELTQPANGLRFALWWEGEIAGLAAIIPHKPGRCAIGYWLGEAFLGKGLMTCALEALLAYGKESLGIADFFAGVTHGNTASAAVLQRLGFEAVAEFDDYTRFHRPA